MKKINKQMLRIGVLIFTILILTSCTSIKQKKGSNDYIVDQNDFIKGTELIDNIALSPLNDGEIAGLVLMREEEKLARDVYLTLYKKWEIKIFNNIASSEQTHTNAVKVLLDRYNISDPIKDDNIGSFTSEELAKLYTALIAKGNVSPLDALIVGATVEDLDIKDLNELLSKTDNEDIITTYNNLNKGSRNHLRAFMKQIKSKGGTYSPQYISQAEFDSIISSEQERGRAK